MVLGALLLDIDGKTILERLLDSALRDMLDRDEGKIERALSRSVDTELPCVDRVGLMEVSDRALLPVMFRFSVFRSGLLRRELLEPELPLTEILGDAERSVAELSKYCREII